MSDTKQVVIIPLTEKYYNNETNFGVFYCDTTDEYKNSVRYNKYKNFSVSGIMPRLNLNTEYKAELKDKIHPEYGHSYEIVTLIQDRPKTINEQQAFIRSILTESQAEAIIEKYPNHDLLSMFENDEIDYSDIKGIKEKTYKHIKEKILKHTEIMNALTELSPLGMSLKMIYNLVSHYESVDILLQKIKENIYILTEISGIGFKTVDKFALKQGIKKDNLHRLLTGFIYILQEEAKKGHSWISISELHTKARELLQVEDRIISIAIKDIKEKEDKRFYIHENIIALYRYYFYEKKIKDKIIELLEAENKFSVEHLEEKIKRVEEEQGFKFTKEQLKAIHMAVNKNVLVINGSAGTGKSSLLKGILTVLDEYSYDTCALSGAAAMRIASMGLESKTIHRLLGYNGENYNLNESEPIDKDIVVLDEAGMVGSDIFYRLITAIKKGSKFIIVGDFNQLSPIGTANIFKDLINSGVVPTIELTQVHRQALKSGILSSANRIKEGKQINDRYNYTKQVLGELEDLYLFPMEVPKDVLEKTINICKRYNGDIMDFQVLTSMRNRGELSTKNLNNKLRDIFNPGDKPFIKRGQTIFKEGDKIIQEGNNYNDNLFNGQIGRVYKVFHDSLLLDFGNDTIVEYDREQLDMIEPAYAITVHKYQGSQNKHILIALDYSSYILLNRQLVYTALTRAQKSCILICENRALHHAIRTSESDNRNTFLLNLLTYK